MDRSPKEAVVAGSRAFAVALLAPVTARVGSRPRIAADAAQALALCRGPDGVVVIEYAGEASLPGIERLVREGGGLRVVVAVPPEHAGAAPALRSLGVSQVVRWEGRPEEVVGAIPSPPDPARRTPALAPPTIAVVGPARLAGPALDAGHPWSEPPAAAAAGSAAPDLACATPPPLPLPSASRTERSDWPAAMPSQAEATEVLLCSLAGTLPPGAPLGAVAEQVLVGLSALEREVLLGDPQPFDPAPVRAAAVMRLRVAAALATAPSPGAAVDRGALHGLLGEIDDLLAKVKVLLQAAPHDARLGLEAVRNALVREAIAFSEAAGGGGPAPGGAATPAPAAQRRAAATRSLAAGAPPRRRRPTGLLVLLAIVAVAALGYHGWTLYAHPAPVPPPTFPGAPAGTVGTGRGASRVLMTLPGKRVEPAELERFRRLEASRGNVLRPISPGTWAIEPAAAPEGAKP